MAKHNQRHLPINQRDYQTTQIVTKFSPAAWEKLTFRSLHHHATPAGWIKRILNNYIDLNTNTPSPDAFNRWYVTTAHHQDNHIKLVAPYPEIYLGYLDTLIETLSALYISNGRSRRRIIETLTLIDIDN